MEVQSSLLQLIQTQLGWMNNWILDNALDIVKYFGFDYWTWNGSMKFMSQRIRTQLESIWMYS